MTLRRCLLVLGALLCLVPAATPASAGYEFPICTAPDHQSGPAMSGNIVVWTDSRGWPGIYGKDLSTGREFQVCSVRWGQYSPAISGNIVVYGDARNFLTEPDIYGYDLSTGREFAVCTAPEIQGHATISDNIVVWQDQRNTGTTVMDIYGYDLSTGREFPICTAPNVQEGPAISGNIVVWQDGRNAGWPQPDIYGKDLATGREFPICTAPLGQYGPAISGSIVVWADGRTWATTGYDIYGKDLSTGREFPICTAPGHQWGPAVSGHIVVWMDYRDDPDPSNWTSPDIYGYDLSTGREFAICTAPSWQGYPAISGNIVVWQDGQFEIGDIYGYRLDVDNSPETVPGGPILPPTPAEATTRHYLTGQLHAHWLRDALWGIPLGWRDLTPRELAERYRALGYEWLAPSEHHDKRPPQRDEGGLFERWDPDAAGIVHLGDSMEDTAEDSHILAAAFDHTADGFDFSTVGTAPADDWYDEIWRRWRLQNIGVWGRGLAFIAHPDVRKYLWSDQTLKALVGEYEGIEVFNAGVDSIPRLRAQGLAVATWTRLLAANMKVHAIAGDDFAPNLVTAEDRGCVTVVADVESTRTPNASDITEALRQGRYYASYAPVMTSSLGRASRAPEIQAWWYDAADSRARIRFESSWGIFWPRFFTARNPDRGEECRDITSVGYGRWEASYTCTDEDKWVRAEVRDELGRVSLTQPIWLDRREGTSGQWQPASAGLRAAQAGADTLVVELANARLELPGADPEAQAWGALVPQEQRPKAAPPLGYFGYCYEFQTNAPLPAGATLSIAYDPAEVQICREDALAIYRYEPLTGEWLPLISLVDTVNSRVWAEISQLGMYAVSGDLPEDITAPTVEILVSPGAVLSGEMEIGAEIGDDNGVASARFMLDDMDLGSDTAGRDGWSVPVDFSVIAQGNYMLRVSAMDASGNEVEESVPVVVASAIPAPAITISAPGPGATLPAEFTASGTWSAVKPLAGGLLYLDDLPLGVLVPYGDGYQWAAEVILPWIEAGEHTLRARGSDEDGNQASAVITVLGAHTFTVSASCNPTVVASGGTTNCSATASDSLAHAVTSWAWDDGDAGGSFSPSASAQNPTYTAPVNAGDSDLVVTLTVSASCDGPSPLGDSDSTTLTVEPVAHVISATAATPSPSTVASGGSTSLSASALDSHGHGIASWSWSDGGAGGGFSPSTSVQSPTYTAPENTADSDLIVTLTVSATCDGPSPLSDDDSTTLTVQPIAHSFSVTVGTPSPSTVASGGTSALSAVASDSRTHAVASWSWSDGGAGGHFSPSALVQSPSYTARANAMPSSLTVHLTVTGTCDGPSPLQDSDTVDLTVLPIPPGVHSIGLYDGASSTFYLRNANSAGSANLTVRFGPSGAGWAPIGGDYDADGDDTIGLYNQTSGTFYLRNANAPGPADLTFRYGPAPSTWKPIAGDWDGDGDVTIGLYNPTTGTFYLRNSDSAGAADLTFRFGPTGSNWLPLAGDWDGDGTDTIGLFSSSTDTFYLRNANSAGAADLTFRYGPAGSTWLPMAGDWNGDGTDTVGLFSPSAGTFYLRNTNSAGAANLTFRYGPALSTWLPIAGDWDGM